MSVPNSTSRVSYTLTSTTQTLSVPFYFLATTDLQVIKQGTTPVTLAITTNYTVTGAGVEAGGSITLTGVGVSVSDVITIKRNIALTQPIDLVLNDRLPSTTLERMSDRSTMQIQQVSEIASRSLRFEDGETTDGTLVKTARSSKVLSFDENGDISFITPEGVLYTPGDSLAADSIASLKAISVSGLTNNQGVSVLGYYAAGDGGGGSFYYDSASATADNGGTVIQPTTGTGRWKRVYSGAINAKWFGAKGDGLTNDSVSILAAFAAASGVSVLFPSGTYIYGGTTTISVLANSGIVGDSFGSSILRFTGAITTSIGVSSGVTLRDITIELAGSSGIINSGAITGVSFFNCKFYSLAYSCILIHFNSNSVTDFKVTNCSILTGQYGILLNQGLSASSGIIISDNSITDIQADCIAVNAPAGTPLVPVVSDVTITDNLLTTATNTAHTSDRFCISLAGVSNATIIGNTLRHYSNGSAYQQALHVEDWSENVSIIGNKIFGQNIAIEVLIGSGGLSDGHILITGNNIVSTVGRVGAGININIDANGTPANCIIDGNYISGMDTGIAFYANAVVSNNVVKNCNKAYYAFGSSISGGIISGCTSGVSGGGAATQTELRGVSIDTTTTPFVSNGVPPTHFDIALCAKSFSIQFANQSIAAGGTLVLAAIPLARGYSGTVTITCSSTSNKYNTGYTVANVTSPATYTGVIGVNNGNLTVYGQITAGVIEVVCFNGGGATVSVTPKIEFTGNYFV